jgi:hypothetical protein
MHSKSSRSYGGARCVKRKSRIPVAILLCLVCASVILIPLSVMESAKSQSEQTCARIDAFVRILEIGIPLPPDPTDDERAITDVVNGRIRVLLQAAIPEGC